MVGADADVGGIGSERVAERIKDAGSASISLKPLSIPRFRGVEASGPPASDA
jgi:hypothetical protein